ncbi:MAG: hypothetical protein RIS79_288 [Verrucomicrobiota bacterium]
MGELVILHKQLGDTVLLEPVLRKTGRCQPPPWPASGREVNFHTRKHRGCKPSANRQNPRPRRQGRLKTPEVRVNKVGP